MYVTVDPDSVSVIGNSYMADAFTMTWDEHIESFSEQIEGHKVEFDTVVGIGLSGMLVLPIIAKYYNCHMLALRKNGSSDNHVFESDINHIGEGSLGRKWLLIDDFVASGVTANKVRNSVDYFASLLGFKTEFVGIYGYQRGYFNAAKYYAPVPIGKPYRPSSLKRIQLDGQDEFINAELYNRCLENYNAFAKTGVTNIKTAVLENLRQYYNRYDLAVATKALIHIENIKR